MVQIWKPDTCSCEFEVTDAQESLINARVWCELHFNSARTDDERFENAKETCMTKNRVVNVVRDELKIPRNVRIPFTVDSGGMPHVYVQGSKDAIRKLQGRLNTELHPLRPILEVKDG